MKYISLLCFLLISNICLSQVIDETQSFFADEQYKNEISSARMLIDSLMDKQSIPGLSITVADQHKVLWAEGMGLADLENNIPVSIHTKFRIGSISKSLTSLALMKLIRQGKLKLTDTVQQYVPYFPRKKYSLTIQDLAAHIGGIRNYDYPKGEYFSDKYYDSVRESINIFKEDSLLFAPKSKYSYSTYGYVLLSAVIEGATNQGFLEYMNDSILSPFGMVNTIPDINHKIIPNRSSLYQLNDGEILNAPYVDNSNKWAGGGYLSTSLDIAKMIQNLLKLDQIEKSILDVFWTPSKLSNGSMTNYCLGWRSDLDDIGRRYVHHGGSSVGGRSFLLVYPDQDVIVSISCNVYASFNEDLVKRIANLFMD